MRFSRGLVLFSYGLFTIAAQSLLFREFITTFEGNDISVGVFFACWFLWVGLGAFLVSRIKYLSDALLKHIEVLFLVYLPAFILELFLIIQARELAGIESYELWTIRSIVLMSILLNAPISLVTGMLFPTACRWVEKEQCFPVWRVYVLEAAGSFAGGLAVTILLGFGVSLIRIFAIISLVLSFSVFIVFLCRFKKGFETIIRIAVSLIVPACLLVFLLMGFDEPLTRSIRKVKWGKLLPEQSYTGSFHTAQSEYLYGEYQGQWITVCQGSVLESLPDEENAGRVAAIGLSQKPDAKKVLVIGTGLGLSRAFLQLEQVEEVVWAHYDIEYIEKINDFVPVDLHIDDERFKTIGTDIRLTLEQERERFDLVYVQMPETTSSVLNRYYTVEFYQQLKVSMDPEGVLIVNVASGENIMGTELMSLGASVKQTLEKVFSNFVLVPGEESWFVSSDSNKLKTEPGICRDRFASIKGASDLFPPEGLLSVYLPDRAAFALEQYESVNLPERYLLNSDSKPLTYLYSILLTAKQSGAPTARIIKHLMLAGVVAFIIPIVIFMVLRVSYLLKSSGAAKVSSFDSCFLVFSAGIVAIGVEIVLMYLYQTRFGSLYLHIGIISSLFMVGLMVGAIVIRYLPGNRIRLNVLSLVVLFLHIILLGSIGYWPLEEWRHLYFAAAFVLGGFFVGCYFPLAAKQLSNDGFDTGMVGSRLEMSDHLGATSGGLLTSLALVPVLGTRTTLMFFIVLLLANVPAILIRLHKRGVLFYSVSIRTSFRGIGYALFGAGLSLVICSNYLLSAGVELRENLPQYAAQSLAGEKTIKQLTKAVEDEINYYEVYGQDESPTGYIFSSQDFAPEVRGFGGKMNVAIYVDKEGGLINFHVLQSNETPGYLEMLGSWQKNLKGKGLFKTGDLENVEAVTGATVSCEAIVEILNLSGQHFARDVLGLTMQTEIKKAKLTEKLFDQEGIYLIFAIMVTLIVVYKGGFWSRFGILIFNMIVGGFLLNTQLSSEQMVSILSGQVPSIRLSGVFILAVGIPVVVIFFGNIYCGYLCPFGATQELLGYVIKKRNKPQVSNNEMRWGRFVKYLVLLIFIFVFFVSRNRTTLRADPLISIFNIRTYMMALAENYHRTILVIAAAVFIGALFYGRFWCRYLCPVGAFLSLLNNVTLLKNHIPVKWFGRCEYGLNVKDNMDCIYCDKCRFEEPFKLREDKEKKFNIFLTFVIAVALTLSAASLRRFLQVIPAGFGETVTALPASGEPRDVDMVRVREMIEQQQLSEREAEYYKNVE
ncbi:MAG: 4Fe-4S binding protein [Planctomycetota bacterium]|jgi:spermidine synthase/Na+-translocating ferredoxin:NAD+ oxidoreductase RnfG subunit